MSNLRLDHPRPDLGQGFTQRKKHGFVAVSAHDCAA
jgi:hypothetical protein